MKKDTPSYICLEERVEDSFESMEVERVEDSFDSIEEKKN